MTQEQDLSELTVEEQVALLKAQPDGGQTDNSPPDDVEQPSQDSSWVPPVTTDVDDNA